MKNSGHINILIVDDNASTVQLLKRMLKTSGFDTIGVHSGDEAMDAVARYDLALILMDVMMPGKSGIDTAKLIWRTQGKSHIPIIFMTAGDKEEPFEFEVYAAGAVDFIYKPINPMVLKSKVRVFAELHMREKRLATSNEELEQTLRQLKKEVRVRKRAHQALKRSENKTRRLNKLREDMEFQLQQAQKMEAVGTLAGGIAHDFNNILAAIMGYIELAQFDVPESNPVRHSLDQVLKAAHRAKKLVSRILAFSRQKSYGKKPVYIQDVIEECVELLRASIPTTVAIRKTLSKEKKAVEADSTQIHQVIMNLCTNAYHAMNGCGGIIDIRVSPCHMDEKSCRAFIDLEPGEYMKLDVVDSGCGMDVHTLSKIFDPYFTTKPKGEGTGMGLSVVHGIMKAHDGGIQVKSDLGKGTRFTLYFPVIAMDVGANDFEADILPMGRERVLFVDDEQILVDLGRKILERLGYSVVSETSSVNAVKVFRKDPEGFDLVITDMTMPDLTGLQLARQIKIMSPGTPVILCTGYNKEINANKIKEFGIDHLVFKPLKIMDLAKVIREAVKHETPLKVCGNG